MKKVVFFLSPQIKMIKKTIETGVKGLLMEWARRKNNGLAQKACHLSAFLSLYV